MDVQVNPITHHRITLMTPLPGRPELFGWIQLKNGEKDAGYIYIKDKPEKPLLGSSRYIVTSIPLAQFPAMIEILRTEKPLQIRYHDSAGDGSNASVFIEDAGQAIEADNFSSLPAELEENLF
jgi:hypothetical protein